MHQFVNIARSVWSNPAARKSVAFALRQVANYLDAS